MTMQDGDARHKYRGRGLHLDQHNHRRDDSNRGSRLHRDAQRAMVGIRLQRVHMRHLDHNQQRQQGQTQQSRCPKSAGLLAAALTEI
jgi:hypothetical protein